MSRKVRTRGWKTVIGDLTIYGVAFGLTNLISFAYIVVAGRTLSGPQFGLFNALLGVITIAGFFAGSLQLAVTQAAANNMRRSSLIMLTASTWRVAVPCIVLLLLAALPLAAAIGASQTEIAICGLTVLIMFLGCAPMGILAAIGRIRGQAGVNLLGAMARLGTGWPLILAGFGVAGLLLGYVVNYALVLTFAIGLAWRFAGCGTANASTNPPHVSLNWSSIATFVLAFAPLGMDQILVQAFAPSQSGDYAAVATAGKLVFFAAYPIMAVAYPRFLGPVAPRQRLRDLSVAAAALVCIVAGLAGALQAFPGQIIDVLFGTRFAQVAPYVGQLGFAIALFSISALGAHALNAWSCRAGYLPSLIALVAGVGLFAARHDSLATVVANQVWICTIQFVLIAGLLGLTLWQSTKPHNSHISD